MSEVCGHGFYPRQAVHLAVGSLERGVMMQIWGINRARYYSRFDFVRVQHLGDGINDELRIYNSETSLILPCPRFVAMDFTLGKRCTWL